MATTVYRGASGGAKPFTWSYTRLKNFESCRKRHYEVDILKSVREEAGEALLWGNRAHDAFAARLNNSTPFPEGMENFEPYALRLITSPGNLVAEQSMALTRDFGACGFFDRGVWFRAKIDAIKIMGRAALVVDWKTGKIVEDSVQLALSAACVFAKYPEVQKIRSRFVWLAEDAETDEDFVRGDMPVFWKNLWPRIEALEHAHNTTTYPADPGRLCRKWCPVKDCPHWGKQHG